LFREYVHLAEDAFIAPAQTLYLHGCNLSCVFCQTGGERKTFPGRELTPRLFREILDNGRRRGAVSVDILGGEPGVNLPALLDVFAAVEDFPLLVWNTNLYITAEACALLDGVVDVFLADVKFGNPECAQRLSGRKDATRTAWERAKEIFARTPDALVLRHLAMPGHFSCCTRPLLEAIRASFPGVRVSLRTVYLPPHSLPDDMAEKRFSSRGDIIRVLRLAGALGLNLTRDAVLWENGMAGPGRLAALGENKTGDSVEFELTINPAGEVFLRHAVPEAVDVLKAVGSNIGDGTGAFTHA
jgi:putative pyruvate formate lyase activating enzyme